MLTIVLLTLSILTTRSQDVTCDSIDNEEDIHLKGVFLHGLGDTPKGWAFLNDQNFANVDWHRPAAPIRTISFKKGVEMTGWFDLWNFPVDSDSKDDESGILESVKVIHSILDDLIDSGVSSQDIFVGGFSQGGAVAMLATYMYSKPLAGCICLSGWLQLRSRFDTLLNEVNMKTPLFWGHGSRDNKVLVDTLEIGVEAMKQAGLTSIDSHEYENLKHLISSEEMSDLVEWINLVRRSRGGGGSSS
jgi:predicted esterase